jgi:hypothetical protein
LSKESGVQEYRSSGVAGVQEFRSSVVAGVRELQDPGSERKRYALEW